MTKKRGVETAQTLREYIQPQYASKLVTRGQMIQYVRVAFEVYRREQREQRWYRRLWRLLQKKEVPHD